MEEIKMNVVAKDGTLTIRKGDAEKPIEKIQGAYHGNIYAPVNFAEKKQEHGEYIYTEALAIIDKSKPSVEFITNINSTERRHIVNGSLIHTEEFEKFHINTSHEFDLLEFRDLVRKNKMYFKQHTE